MADMPCSRKLGLDSALVDTLMRVPQLLIECSRQGVLEELRCLCKQACSVSTAEITRITVNFEEPVLCTSLAHFLQSCSICCLRIMLHSSRFDCLEDDLTEFVSKLAPGLSHVSQICISLQFSDQDLSSNEASDQSHDESESSGVEDPHQISLAGAISATVVRMLAPVCSPLTSVSITGAFQLERGASPIIEFDLLSLLQALHDVHAAATLQSLKVCISSTSLHPTNVPPTVVRTVIGDVRGVLARSDEHARVTCLSLLHGLDNLTSLTLSGGCFFGEEGWEMLPPKLRKLDCMATNCAPAEGRIMPFLQELHLTDVQLSTLAQIVSSAPALTTLHLQRVEVHWCSTEEFSLLTKILQQLSPQGHDQRGPSPEYVVPHSMHQQERSEAVAAAGCNISVMSLCGSSSSEVAVWDFLSKLPVMTSINSCGITFWEKEEDVHRCEDLGHACLRHMLQVFPNVCTVSIAACRPTRRAVKMLSALKSLQRVIWFSDSSVCAAQMDAWRALLPAVVDFQVRVW